MYILGLSSSCGTSGICPAWYLLSINWLRLFPKFGACVQSHTVRRRLFIFLMTAAHISPNVFSLRNLLSNIHVLFLTIHSTSFKPIIHHIHTNNYLFYLHDIPLFYFFGSSWLPSVSCVHYNTVLEHSKACQVCTQVRRRRNRGFHIWFDSLLGRRFHDSYQDQSSPATPNTRIWLVLLQYDNQTGFHLPLPVWQSPR